MIPPRFNPLACGNTALPPQLLILAKFVVIGLFVSLVLRPLGDSRLAFLPALEHASDWLPYNGWRVLFLLSSGLLVFNVAPRLTAFSCGALLFYALLISRLQYSNNAFFCGCLLVLVGLSNRQTGGWLIRFQLVVLYFGAGLDKAVSPAWQDGTFFDAWQGERAFYAFLAAQFPPLVAAKALSWATIVTEFGLAIGFALRRGAVYAAWVGASFHLMTVLMGESFYGMFVLAAIASYVSVLSIPDRIEVSVGDPAGWRARWVALLGMFDADDRLALQTSSGSQPAADGLSLHMGSREYRGISAFQLLLLVSPIFYAFVVLVTVTFFVPFELKVALVSALVVLLFPFGALGGLAARLRG